ncbi:hypothetical protein key_107 [Erwinia phage KEY]|uniref:Uncharacterized protein n=2 Tax=Keyvirus TaxID=3152642 RepID=A0AAE8BG16_9CAUD|nr:hypothetical protein AAS21_gp119 [Pantoea phage vB_PagS_AAS21]QYC51598.1 hypothetical protein key_107 [Erwinia phage KEY]
MDRALRRHHQARIKNKVKNYNNYYGLLDPLCPRKIGIYSKTRRICSCMMCSGYKKLYGNGKAKHSFSDLRKLDDPDY